MRQSTFDFIDNLDTLLAVIVGAVLATGGAMVAELVQDRLGQKRKEREAARFFGEMLTSVDRILDRAFASMELGERWGSVSRRMFKTALDESGVYQRNRERLFEIRDIQLRRMIHTHFLEGNVPLVALVDYWDELDKIAHQLNEDELMGESRRNALLDKRERFEEMRLGALESVRNQHARTDAICERLQPIADLEF